MKFTITGSNIKVLGKAIHSLAKLGEELYIEPVSNGVAFRTVNSALSAFACFTFKPTFFELFDTGALNDNNEVTRCKISMKSCLTVFKSLSALEKNVEKCKIRLDTVADKLVFQLHCRHGIVRTYNLMYAECETLQLQSSDDDQCANEIVASTRLLLDAVQNFQLNQEEVTLTVSSVKMVLKNYTADELDQAAVVRTEMTLDPDEFDKYAVDLETSVTFCMKELRAFLSFSDVFNYPVSILFDSPGKPLTFRIDSDPHFVASFVLATLKEGVAASQASVAGRRAAKVPARSQAANAEQRPQNAGPQAIPGTSGEPRPILIANGLLDQDVNGRQSDIPTDQVPSSLGAISETARAATRKANNDAEEESSRERRQACLEEMCIPQRPRLFQDLEGKDDDSDETTCDEADESVPGTPPNKKFKSIYEGLSQATLQSKDTVILASDTDED